MANRPVYFRAIMVLAGGSLVLSALIFVGELRDLPVLGSGALGLILVAYGLIGLFLRKLGLIGPRRAEGK